MKKTYEFWTTVEIAYLKELRLDGRPIKGIAKALKRTFWSVAKKLDELKIRQPGRKKREKRSRIQNSHKEISDVAKGI